MDGYRVLARAKEAASGGNEDVESHDVWQVPLSGWPSGGVLGGHCKATLHTALFLMWMSTLAKIFPQLGHGFFLEPLYNFPLVFCERKAW